MVGTIPPAPPTVMPGLVPGISGGRIRPARWMPGTKLEFIEPKSINYRKSLKNKYFIGWDTAHILGSVIKSNAEFLRILTVSGGSRRR